MSVRSSASFVVGVLLAGAAGGCAMKKAAPADASAPEGGKAADDGELAAAEQALASNAARLQSLGVARDAPKPKPKRSSDAGGGDKTPDGGGRTEPRPADDPPPGGEPPPQKPPATDPDALGSTASDESATCTEICALAQVACDLERRICGLAEDHEGDARYENACWNAQRQCEDASDACSECGGRAG